MCKNNQKREVRAVAQPKFCSGGASQWSVTTTVENWYKAPVKFFSNLFRGAWRLRPHSGCANIDAYPWKKL